MSTLAALAAGCATTGAVPQPFPTPGGPAPAAVAPVPEVEPGVDARPPDSSRDTYALTGTALALRGAPYRNGGSDPTGFDCSGFVWYVFDQHGVHLPRTVTELFEAGAPVDRMDLRPGDLVFFDTGSGGSAGRASHVGISIGGDEFVHAPSTTGLVRVERLASTYWSPRFLQARRVW